MKQNVLGIVFSLIGFTVGFMTFKTQTENQVSLRDPATSQEKVFQISNLSSDEIATHLQKKINISATQNGLKQISFKGFSASICGNYSTIELELSAEGMSVAGEAPVLKIKAPCEASQDQTGDIAAVTLPIELLLKEKPRNAEYTFSGYKSVMTLMNSSDVWAQTWVMRKVEFKNMAGAESKQAVFGRAPASAEAARPIIIEF